MFPGVLSVLEDGQLAAWVERFGVGNPLTAGILLVDDEPLNITVLRSFLQDGWTVHEASSGEAALGMIEGLALDVVITDQRMPGMSGVALLAELRRRRPDVAGIVLTGYTDVQALESAINTAGVFRFLRKPWQPAEIRQAIESASAAVAQRRIIESLLHLLSRRTDELSASLGALEAQQAMLLGLERLGTIGRLAAGITHDLRNVILGLREVEFEISQHAVAPALRETLAVGIRGVDSLLVTLQTLHDYARGGGILLELKPLELASVVQDALAISRVDPLFRRRGVTVAVQPGLPRVAADRQKLTQVILNLVRNALQAAPEVAVRIRVGTAAPDALAIAVEDDGPGVPEAVRARLFEPFVSSKGESGLGMGLYMARLVVEAHGGRITLLDGPTRGARFEVRLPVRGG